MSLEGNAKAGYVLEGKINGIPRVDDTLTKEGWCADAKVTGDRLRELEGYKDEALDAAESATKSAEEAKKAAQDAEAIAGERLDKVEEDVEDLKADVEDLKTNGGGGGSGGSSGGDGDHDHSEINQRMDVIELRVESVEGDMSTITQRADGIELRVEGAEDDISQLEQTVDGFTFSVSKPTVNGEGTSKVTLSIGFNGAVHTGEVVLNGNMDISGELSASALYAVLGDMAMLTVDSLSTSRRIPKYLARDKSDDNYITIRDQHIVLRRAWTDGTTEQAVDPNGQTLYWEKDISTATLNDAGYPEIDGVQVFTTPKTTDWPVTVYRYQEGDRLRFFFDEDNNYGPRMVWGEGYGAANPEQGKAYIQKLGNSLDMYFHGSDDVKKGIFIGDDYVDIVGLRKPIDITFDDAAGTCTITMQGGREYGLTFNKDATGKIISATDTDGHTFTLGGM